MGANYNGLFLLCFTQHLITCTSNFLNRNPILREKLLYIRLLDVLFSNINTSVCMYDIDTLQSH